MLGGKQVQQGWAWGMRLQPAQQEGTAQAPSQEAGHQPGLTSEAQSTDSNGPCEAPGHTDHPEQTCTAFSPEPSFCDGAPAGNPGRWWALEGTALSGGFTYDEPTEGPGQGKWGPEGLSPGFSLPLCPRPHEVGSAAPLTPPAPAISYLETPQQQLRPLHTTKLSPPSPSKPWVAVLCLRDRDRDQDSMNSQKTHAAHKHKATLELMNLEQNSN